MKKFYMLVSTLIFMVSLTAQAQEPKKEDIGQFTNVTTTAIKISKTFYWTWYSPLAEYKFGN